MNCYLCDQGSHPGGTHYGVKAAVGICHNCGIGVCAEHSNRSSEPGAPLLCPSCAELLRKNETRTPYPVVQTA